MRLRILTRPIGTIAGITLDGFRVGGVYDLRNQIACVFLAEGWAEIVSDDEDDAYVRPPPGDISKAGPVVLVVDDEPDVQHLTKSLLTAHGYHVIVAVTAGKRFTNSANGAPTSSSST